MYAIEKNVPLPGHNSSGSFTSQYPLHIMETGDSFLVAVLDDTDRRKVKNRITSAISRLRASKTDSSAKRFVIRYTVEGVRCWRTS